LALASFFFLIASRQFVCLDLPKRGNGNLPSKQLARKSVAANDVLELVLK